MKILNIIYFLIGYPYFLVQAFLVAFLSSGTQAYLAYKLEKFPWQISMEDTIEYIDDLFKDKE